MVVQWIQWLFRERRQRTFWLIAVTAFALLYQAHAQAQVNQLPGDAAEWVGQNLLAVMVLAFHFGVSWREFRDHHRRIELIEDFIRDTLPLTYMNRDLVAVKFDTLTRDISDIKDLIVRNTGG